MDEESIDGRRDERVAVRLNVRISTIDPEPDAGTGRPHFRTSEETCANVSRGGVFVATAEPVAPGRRLLLELDLPGGRIVEAIGRVAWTKSVLAPASLRSESGIGIEFLGGPSDHLAALEDWIRAQTTRRASPRPLGPARHPAPSGGA